MPLAESPNCLTKKVNYFLLRERNRDASLLRLLDELPSVSPAYLFGGIIRDIALFGNRDTHKSDIDIVCDGQESQLRSFLEEFSTKEPFRQNKFDGFRIKTENWSIDIWPAKNTWAFKQGIRTYKGIQSLLETTITNWESILFPLHGGPLIYREGYFDDVLRGYLDVILVENPNPIGMYVKIIRSYADKGASEFSRRAVEVLRKAVSEHSFEEFSSYEKAHYGNFYISKSIYNQIMKLSDRGVVGPIRLAKANETLPLFPILGTR